MKELKIGNDHVDSAVIKGAIMLNAEQKIAHKLPNTIVWEYPMSEFENVELDSGTVQISNGLLIN